MKFVPYTIRHVFTMDEVGGFIDTFKTSQKERWDLNDVGGTLQWDQVIVREQWVQQRIIERLVEPYNRRLKLRLDGFIEPLRILRYGIGDHCDPHSDYTETDTSKLAFGCILKNADMGGRFGIVNCGVISVMPGFGIIYPAFSAHWVTPVKKGVRYCLVGWVSGPRFV